MVQGLKATGLVPDLCVVERLSEGKDSIGGHVAETTTYFQGLLKHLRARINTVTGLPLDSLSLFACVASTLKDDICPSVASSLIPVECRQCRYDGPS